MNFFEAFRLVYNRQPTLTEASQFVNDPVGQQNVINQATRMQEQTTQTQSEPVQVAEEPVQVAEEPVQVAEDTSGMFTGTQNDINTGFIDTSAGFAEQTSVDLDKRKANIEQELRNQYDLLQLGGFNYINPEDLDNIFSRQAEAIAIAGVDSLLDIGKRTEKVRDNVKEVQQITDPETGEVTYQYTPSGLSNIAGITEPEPVTVENEYVKPMVSNDGLYGSQVTKYVATLPDEAPVLYNKKTGERLNMFSTKGELYRDYGNGATFGELYSGIEGGVDLKVQFDKDGTPVFFPLYKDTSDKNLISALTTVGSLIVAPYAGQIGSFVTGTAASTAGAKAIGAAILGGVAGGVTGEGNLESIALGAVLAGATTYGIQSGFVGDALVDLGVPESFLNGDNPLGFKIPISNTLEPQAYLNELATEGYTFDKGEDGFVQIFDKNGLPDSSLTDQFNQNLVTYPNAKLTTFEQDMIDTATGEVVSEGTGIEVTDYSNGALSTTNYDIGSSGGYEQVGETITTGFDASEAANIERSLEAAEQAGVNIEDINTINEAITESGGVIENLPDNIKELATAVGGTLTAAGVDLKNIFGGTIGGLLEKGIGAGIDYFALGEIQDKLQQAGKDIQADYDKVFKPVTVRTGLGVGTITPEEATATADIAYQPIKTSALGTAESMFKDLPTTREEATAKSLEATRALTEPQRQRQQEDLFNRLQRQGLMGFGVTTPTVGGQRRINPLAESVFAAQEQARAQEALAAQEMGLGQAASQQQLATGLLSTAQGIDRAAMSPLEQARSISSLRMQPELEGLRARQGYDSAVALSEIERIRGLQSGARGLFGLPTQQGNVASTEQTDLFNNFLNYLSQQQNTTTT